MIAAKTRCGGTFQPFPRFAPSVLVAYNSDDTAQTVACSVWHPSIWWLTIRQLSPKKAID